MFDSMFAGGGRPSLRYAGALEKPVGEQFVNPLHHNPEEAELMLITEGEGTFIFDGHHYFAGPGTIMLYNQGLWHDERSHSHLPFRTLYLGIADLQLSGLPPGYFIARDESPVISLGEHYFSLAQRLRELVEAKRSREADSDLLADHLLMVFLVELVRIIHQPKSPGFRPGAIAASQTVHLAKRLIHERYIHDITLHELARHAHVSPFHLCRLFKRETGHTLFQYITRYRMEVAERYLTTTDETIATIAGLVGYQSETYFQSLFKRCTGTSPGRYRAKLREHVRK
ncbi:AraC family transcriptional regulator [Paenibacillus sp. OV219]|uniref:helix-turn-helix transcriptional regulator n=1 Tax=Paenibacillus sp. OV219 TaxID=1884377 RepID=UPI0008C8BFB4|nr:AraC family transcriptional regulator [Paenibacillus sp. OV219]SEO76151.1 AraC-type DNA-binding protein [Paenibacillus sp. OV219]